VSVSVDLARQVLDLGARLRRPEHGSDLLPQAEEQLRGAVAIHNILERERVAYLADEVGMGKTYVALGAVALFRHFSPTFRVAVIAPRENIQAKWMKEWFNFATHIARVPDLRIKALHGGPARPLVKCDNLHQLIRETSVDADRDFFLRMSSFSLGSGGEEADLRALRSRYQRELPWIGDAIGSLRSKREFKDNLAKALCCGLPTFDLVVVDEAHNLKHGFAERIAARNRVMAFLFGRASDEVDESVFRDYGSRAQRVLFLSATPIEDDYRQLWNQLDVFGRGDPYAALRETAASEEEKRSLTKRFLVRRVTSLTVGGENLTKNLYRREWRRGGLSDHDAPIRVEDVRQRLVVALVQKKVSELLNTPKFGASFQMGMLASFESFLETAKLKKADDESGNFDDGEQTDDEDERQGIDVHAVNQLAADYRKKFNGQELPHPKMDALVAHLSRSWVEGRKALVFLRRVASVWEVKERLDLAYNDWLIRRLRAGFEGVSQIQRELEELYASYCATRAETRKARLAARMGRESFGRGAEQDRGGDDTFFAWFFRGEGPDGGWLSGAKFSRRFGESQYELSTFFEDNYVADLLGAPPGGVLAALASATGLDAPTAEGEVAERAGFYLTQAKRLGRRELFEGAQGGALDLLRQRASDPELRGRAAAVWQLRFELRLQATPRAAEAVTGALEYETLFTALRTSARGELRRALWPDAKADFVAAFHERELRRELLSTLARLGHPVVDLYVAAMRRRGTLRLGSEEGGSEQPELERIPYTTAVLDLLAEQQGKGLGERGWGAFDELASAAEHFRLILDVNEPGAQTAKLAEIGRSFGALLRQQQPVGGMTGEVNKTLVRQFRMPGYPFVLLSTDLLQEGEDLHTFCSEVYHYGLAWTPSAVEQRIGRVDRVRSKTERTAAATVGALSDQSRLQVYYPHLEDTVERLQVRRVLRRMHEFIRLMHEGLSGAPQEASRLNVAQEIIGVSDLPPVVTTPLKTSFPVEEKDLVGSRAALAVTPDMATRLAERLSSLRSLDVLGGRPVTWEYPIDPHGLSGTLSLAHGRGQPFVLHLESFGEHLVVRCVSPVGRLDHDDAFERAKKLSRGTPEQVGIVEEADDRGHDLTVEEEVLLGEPSWDVERIGWLVGRLTAAADRFERSMWRDVDASVETFRAALMQEGKTTHVDRAH
jgi:superfamily II DNA or RNA helicase